MEDSKFMERMYAIDQEYKRTEYERKIECGEKQIAFITERLNHIGIDTSEFERDCIHGNLVLDKIRIRMPNAEEGFPGVVVCGDSNEAPARTVYRIDDMAKIVVEIDYWYRTKHGCPSVARGKGD